MPPLLLFHVVDIPGVPAIIHQCEAVQSFFYSFQNTRNTTHRHTLWDYHPDTQPRRFTQEALLVR